MALGEIPPWLNVSPPDYLRAIQAGGAAGLGIAEARNRAREAAARTAEAQRQAAQREWEFNERMRQAAAEQASGEALKQAQLAQQEKYQEGMLGYHNRSLDDAMTRAGMQADAKGNLLDLRAQHYNDLMDWRNRELGLREQVAANKMQPTDYETVTEETPAVEGIPGTPAIPAEKRSLLGMDWLMPDKPAVPAYAGVPGIPKMTHTRRVPINQPQGGSLLDEISNPVLDEESTSQRSEKRIHVRDSKGKDWTIPEWQVDLAKQQGFKVVE